MRIPQGCRLQLPLLDGQGERSGVVTLRLHTTPAISLLLSSQASRHTDTLVALNDPAPPHLQVLSFTGFISTKVQILTPHPQVLSLRALVVQKYKYLHRILRISLPSSSQVLSLLALLVPKCKC